MSEPAPLRPSSASMWGECHGWRPMTAGRPNPSTPESRLGDAAHEIAEILAQSATVPNREYRFEASAGRELAHGIEVHREIFDGAVLWAETLAEWCAENRCFDLNLESALYADRINVNVWGTGDAWAYSPAAARVLIGDYKFGHDLVDVWPNAQLLCYAAGALDQLQIDGVADQHLTVDFIIVQPRCFRAAKVRRHSVKASDLRAHFNKIRVAAEANMRGDGDCTAGAHCKHCPARFDCPAANAFGEDLYVATARPVPIDASPREIGASLNMLEVAHRHLGALVKGYREQVLHLIKSGEPVPGWQRDFEAGKENWNAPKETIVGLGDLVDPPIEIYKKVPLTPKQARDAGVPENLVNALSKRGSVEKLNPVAESDLDIFKET